MPGFRFSNIQRVPMEFFCALDRDRHRVGPRRAGRERVGAQHSFRPHRQFQRDELAGKKTEPMAGLSGLNVKVITSGASGVQATSSKRCVPVRPGAHLIDMLVRMRRHHRLRPPQKAWCGRLKTLGHEIRVPLHKLHDAAFVIGE